MTNDAFLYYDAGDWKNYGLAIPNYGNDTHTQNGAILSFCDTAGRNLQAIMWDVDARLRTPPSYNTIVHIHKLCVRARDLFASRTVPSNRPLMESAHALPAPEVFRVYPVPYFEVRNSWMKDYCNLILLAITEAMQHSENGRPMEISENFTKQVGQYISRVYRMMAVELLHVPFEEANAPDFTLNETHFQAYQPSEWFSSTEMIDTPPNMENWPTEDDLTILTNGIPVTQLPKLGRYPTNPIGQSSGGGNQTGNGNVVISGGNAWPANPTP